MKTIPILALATLLPLGAFTQSTLNPDAAPAESRLQVLSRAAHERVWAAVSREALPSGQNRLRTNSMFIEIATGLCFRDSISGEWRDSQEVIRPVAGGALADQGQHVVFWPNQLADGPVKIQFNGKLINVIPRFLAYGQGGGQGTLISELSGTGSIVAPNQVIYSDVCADAKVPGVVLRFSYTRAGLEQDLLFTDALPPEPAVAGDELTLEVWSEIVSADLPQVEPAPAVDSLLPDVSLDFGALRIGVGKGFSLGTSGHRRDLRVVKEFTSVQTPEGPRHFLVEKIPARQFFAMAALPKAEGASLRPPSPRSKMVAGVPAWKPRRKPGTGRSPLMELALAPRWEKGAYIDWLLLNASLTNYVFASDQTYYCSGTAQLFGTTVLEPAVIKFTNHPAAGLVLNGPLVSKTEPYRPAILTDSKDSSVGESVASGSPTANNSAVFIDAAAAQTNAYRWLRFSYASTALKAAGFTNGVWHCQFVSCGTAIESSGSGPLPIRNALIAQCSNAVVTAGVFSGEHLTVDQCTNLLSGSGSSGMLTNTVLSAVANLGNITASQSSFQFASGSGFYQPVAAGACYVGSWTETGSRGIHPGLLSDLKVLTVDPPIVLPASIDANTTLGPRAQRGTGVPVPGYYYPALDYIASNVTLNAALTLTNGVAIGLSGSSGFNFPGEAPPEMPAMAEPLGALNVMATSSTGTGAFTSAGYPHRPNTIARIRNVQEQPLALNGSGLFALSNSLPAINLQFTDVFLGQGNRGSLAYAYLPYYSYGTLALKHCKLYGASLSVSCYYSESSLNIATSLINNLLERCSLSLSRSGYSEPLYSTFQNNLFLKGEVSLTTYNFSWGWTLQNNLFDLCTSSLSGDSYTNNVTRSHNGFTASTINGLGGTANKIALNPDYQAGPLGHYYYPTNGNIKSLKNLIDGGSAYSTSLGLYHFTCTTNQVKEASSILDIGFHYAAVDGNGAPIDTDGDGTPDCVEDRNGNGNGGDDATSWQVYNSANGLTNGAGLQVFTPWR